MGRDALRLDAGSGEPAQRRARFHLERREPASSASSMQGETRTRLIFLLPRQSRKPDPNFPILQYHPQRKGGSIEILDHNVAASPLAAAPIHFGRNELTTCVRAAYRATYPRSQRWAHCYLSRDPPLTFGPTPVGLEVASLLALCYFIEHFFPAAPVPPPTPAAATTSKPAEPAASADQPSNRKKEEQAPPAPPPPHLAQAVSPPYIIISAPTIFASLVAANRHHRLVA